MQTHPCVACRNPTNHANGFAARIRCNREGPTWDNTESRGTAFRSLRLWAAVDCVYSILMALYTARSITHNLQGELARTVAALGAEYNSANSPKPLQDPAREGIQMNIIACECQDVHGISAIQARCSRTWLRQTSMTRGPSGPRGEFVLGHQTHRGVLMTCHA